MGASNSQQLPVSLVKRAENRTTRTDRLDVSSQLFTHGNPLGMADDVWKEKPLGERASEIFPHVQQNAVSLCRGQFRHGQGEMLISPRVARVESSNPSPDAPHESRCAIDSEQGEQRHDHPQPRVFKPKAGLRSGLSIIQRV